MATTWSTPSLRLSGRWREGRSRRRDRSQGRFTWQKNAEVVGYQQSSLETPQEPHPDEYWAAGLLWEMTDPDLRLAFYADLHGMDGNLTDCPIGIANRSRHKRPCDKPHYSAHHQRDLDESVKSSVDNPLKRDNGLIRPPANREPQAGITPLIEVTSPRWYFVHR